MEGTSFTAAELARRARVAPELVGRLAGRPLTEVTYEQFCATQGCPWSWCSGCTRRTIDHLVEHIEAVVAERRPPRPPAMCFLDLAGCTRLTEERGDRAAAALATSLADLVEQVSLPHAAARIAAQAGPGQVLVSDQVVAECGEGALSFEPIGTVPLKGVADPVRLRRAARQGQERSR
jgi:class 3 adenylate cyclase